MPGLGPSAFSIADQLGLKLQPPKGQEETVVIDHDERPSPKKATSPGAGLTEGRALHPKKSWKKQLRAHHSRVLQ